MKHAKKHERPEYRILTTAEKRVEGARRRKAVRDRSQVVRKTAISVVDVLTQELSALLEDLRHTRLATRNATHMYHAVRAMKVQTRAHITKLRSLLRERH